MIGESGDFSWTGVGQSLGSAVGGYFNYLGAKEQAQAEAAASLERERIAASNAALVMNSQTMQASLSSRNMTTLAYVALGMITLIILMRVRPTAN